MKAGSPTINSIAAPLRSPLLQYQSRSSTELCLLPTSDSQRTEIRTVGQFWDNSGTCPENPIWGFGGPSISEFKRLRSVTLGSICLPASCLPLRLEPTTPESSAIGQSAACQGD